MVEFVSKRTSPSNLRFHEIEKFSGGSDSVHVLVRIPVSGDTVGKTKLMHFETRKNVSLPGSGWRQEQGTAKKSYSFRRLSRTRLSRSNTGGFPGRYKRTA